jgi:hypothetical protein
VCHGCGRERCRGLWRLVVLLYASLHVRVCARAGPSVQSQDAVDAYIRESLHTANALVGTCRIGRPDDREAVVDPSLKVRTTTTLRHPVSLPTCGPRSGHGSAHACAASFLPTCLCHGARSGDWGGEAARGGRVGHAHHPRRTDRVQHHHAGRARRGPHQVSAVLWATCMT